MQQTTLRARSSPPPPKLALNDFGSCWSGVRNNFANWRRWPTAIDPYFRVPKSAVSLWFYGPRCVRVELPIFTIHFLHAFVCSCSRLSRTRLWNNHCYVVQRVIFVRSLLCTLRHCLFFESHEAFFTLRLFSESFGVYKWIHKKQHSTVSFVDFLK